MIRTQVRCDKRVSFRDKICMAFGHIFLNHGRPVARMCSVPEKMEAHCKTMATKTRAELIALLKSRGIKGRLSKMTKAHERFCARVFVVVVERRCTPPQGGDAAPSRKSPRQPP